MEEVPGSGAGCRYCVRFGAWVLVPLRRCAMGPTKSLCNLGVYAPEPSQ